MFLLRPGVIKQHKPQPNLDHMPEMNLEFVSTMKAQVPLLECHPHI